MPRLHHASVGTIGSAFEPRSEPRYPAIHAAGTNDSARNLEHLERAVTIALSPLAMQVIRSVPRYLSSDFVFTTTGVFDGGAGLWA